MSSALTEDDIAPAEAPEDAHKACRQAARDAWAVFADKLDAGTASEADAKQVTEAMRKALAAQSRAVHVAARAERAARGPMPARHIPKTQSEHLMRLRGETADALFAFLGVGTQHGEAHFLQMPGTLRARLLIGADETVEEAARLGFRRACFLLQHRSGFGRDCVSHVERDATGQPVTVGIKPPEHDPIPEPPGDQARELFAVGMAAHDAYLREQGPLAVAYPSISEKTGARIVGWRAMVTALRKDRRPVISEAQAEEMLLAMGLRGWIHTPAKAA